MSRLAVTGGTGVLGRTLVPKLVAAGHDVVVLSRQAAPSLPAGVTSVPGDLRSGAGLSELVTGADVLLHGATSPLRRTKAVDVDGTRALLSAAAGAGVGHVLYVSICGVDRHPFRYYRRKFEAEHVVSAGPLPWTILRATQFHDLLGDGFGRAFRFLPVVVPRGWVFQPVDVSEVADRLVALVGEAPRSGIVDLGGPEVRPLHSLAEAWMRARSKGGRARTIPVPGRTSRAMRDGLHTVPDQADGTITWEQWLDRRPSS